MSTGNTITIPYNPQQVPPGLVKKILEVEPRLISDASFIKLKKSQDSK